MTNTTAGTSSSASGGSGGGGGDRKDPADALLAEQKLAVIVYLTRWAAGLGAVLIFASTLVGWLLYSSIESKGENTAKKAAQDEMARLYEKLNEMSKQIDARHADLLKLSDKAHEVSGNLDAVSREATRAATEARAEASGLQADVKAERERLPEVIAFVRAVQDAKDTVGAIATHVLKLQEFKDVVRGSTASVPVGVVTAWAGGADAIPPDWALCDGRAYPADANRSALDMALGHRYGGGRLPDYSGQFLRGAPSGPSGAAGVRQEWMTAMPKSPFTTTEDGSHAHTCPYPVTGLRVRHDGSDSSNANIPNDDPQWAGVAVRQVSPSDQQSAEGGKHRHRITGGDMETRPTNTSVLWIMKIR